MGGVGLNRERKGLEPGREAGGLTQRYTTYSCLSGGGGGYSKNRANYQRYGCLDTSCNYLPSFPSEGLGGSPTALVAYGTPSASSSTSMDAQPSASRNPARGQQSFLFTGQQASTSSPAPAQQPSPARRSKVLLRQSQPSTASASNPAPAWMPSKAPERGRAGFDCAGLGKGSQALRKARDGAVIQSRPPAPAAQSFRAPSLRAKPGVFQNLQHIRAVASETSVKASSPLAPLRVPSASRNMGGGRFRGSGFASTPTDTAALANSHAKHSREAGGHSLGLGVSTAGDLSPLFFGFAGAAREREGVSFGQSLP